MRPVPAAPAPERAHLRVVRRRSRRGRIDRSGPGRTATVAALAMIGVVAVVFAVLLEQVVLAQSAFKLADVQRRLAEAEGRHEELLLQAARLGSPDRIERYARDRLGMVAPSDVRYMVARVRSGSGAGLAATAATRPGAARRVAAAVGDVPSRAAEAAP